MDKWDSACLTGLLGGTFDPVHEGHLRLAKELCERGHLQQVIFLPAAIPPHKQGRAISDGEDRLAMLRLATAATPCLQVSDYELRQGGICYTIDTAAHFQRHFGGNLRLIIGMDSLCDLHKWYRARELVQDYAFLIYQRPGYPIPEQSTLVERFGEAGARKLVEAVIEAPLHDVSSTEIRQALRSAKAQPGLLHPEVERYISEHCLYR